MAIKKYYNAVRRLFASDERQSLFQILKSANPQESVQEQVLWLKKVVKWAAGPTASEEGVTAAPSVRLKLLTKTLNEQTEFKNKFSAVLSNVVKNSDPVDFFCEFGMVDSHAFLREMFVRLSHRYLPVYRDYSKLSTVAEEIFEDPESVQWLENCDVNALVDLARILKLSDLSEGAIKKSYSEALSYARKIIVARLQSLASNPQFRNRVPAHERFVLLDLTDQPTPEMIERSRKVILDVYQALQGSGVSIDLVFLLERMKSLLSRLQLIQWIESDQQDLIKIKSIIVSILNDYQEKNSVVGLFSANLSLISKKIVERAGITGEHYIARNKKESRELFWSAAGGGLLTVITTLLKAGIAALKAPLFIEGMLAWVNYSVSFILMQFMHWTLATKTPAMTASVMAAKLRKTRDGKMLDEFVEETVHLTRSAFLAICGNVLFVLGGAILADVAWYQTTGQHFLSNERALYYLKAHNPLTSLTIWYAIYTGAILWLGSAVGGWFENWYVFRGLPQAVAESRRIRKGFGKVGAERISQWLSASVMGLAINVALGFFLAFSTIFGKFFGIPLDVRHVTLSSGTLGLSLASLQNIGSHVSLVSLALSSIVLIGGLNVAVSFAISIVVAAQARGVKLSEYPFLFRFILKRFLTRPRDFFRTPRQIEKN